MLTSSNQCLYQQDAQLRKIVLALHPNIANRTKVQPEQIRDIHWIQVSEQLVAVRNERGGKQAQTGYTRKPAECMRRYTKLRGAAKGGAEKAGASKGPWTEEEDRKVLELVERRGPKRWSQIASELPGEFGALRGVESEARALALVSFWTLLCLVSLAHISVTFSLVNQQDASGNSAERGGTTT